jgi:hypothetical protein
MSSLKGSGRGRLRLVGLLLGAAAVALTGCGTDPIGLPSVEAGPPPPPPPPDSGPRLPPLMEPDAGAPDAGAGDASTDRPPEIFCPATHMQGNPECTFGYHALKRATPEVVLVFDRTSAMLRAVPGTTQTRWGEMIAAVEDSLKRTHAGLRWGLKLFPSTPTSMCNSAGNVTDGLDVPVGLSNLDPLLMRIRGGMPVMGPEGSPLDLGIKKAAAALGLGTSDNPRYLILATDGLPSCPEGPPGEISAIRALSMQEQAGLRSFVIGTATPASMQHRVLNDMAAAGGEPRVGDQRYYPALNKAQMLEALDEITGRLTSCVFTVNALPPTPNFVALNIGNTRIQRDPARREGWNFGGSVQVVHLYGQACAMLKANPLTPAELAFGCPGHEPPPPPPCSMVQP